MIRKIILTILAIFLFSSENLYSNDKIKIKVPSFDETGTIKEITYTKEYPTSLEDSIETINLLIEIYNEVSNNYKTQIAEYEKYTADILNELESVKEKNKNVTEIQQTQNEINNDSNSFIENNLKSYGFLTEYGTLNGSNEISIQFGIKLKSFTLICGPNFLLPKNNSNNLLVGFRGSIGFWF